MIYALIAIAVIAAVLGAAIVLHRAGELADRKRNLPAEWAQEQRERWGR